MVVELIPEHLGDVHEYQDFIEAQLVTNLSFAVAMCRIVYRRRPTPLPAVGDGKGMAEIWKQDYNTDLGRGTVEEFMRNWESHKNLML